MNSIPRDLFSLEGADSLEDVLANVAGVSPSVGDGQRDQVYIRGFAATNDQYVDGVRDSEMYFRDLANVDRVDVIQGPAAALYGHGSAGGIIDRVTRQPTDTPVDGLDVTYGGWGDRRIEADSGGPLVPGSLAYRFDGAEESSGGFRDEYYLQREHVAPSFACHLPTGGRLLVQLDYLKDRRLDDLGLPALVGPVGSGFAGTVPAVPIGTFFGSPDGGADHVEAEVGSAAVRLEKPLRDDALIRNEVRIERYTLDRNNVLPTGVYVPGGSPFDGNLADVWVTRSDRHILRHENDLFDQLEYSRAVHTGAVDQTFLAGTELGRQTAQAHTTQYADPSVALLNPILTDPPAGEAPSSLTQTTVLGTTAALYAQDQIDWGLHWKALLGLRWDYFDVIQGDPLPPYTALRNTSRAPSPRAGVVWEPRSGLSLYGSVSRSFEPSADSLSVAASTAALAPEETTGAEVGIKTDLVPTRLALTAALFQAERNITETNPVTGVVTNSGDQSTRGVDASLVGHLNRRWQASVSACYMDPSLVHAGYDSAGIFLDGHLPALVPRSSVSAFTAVDLGGGFRLGAGAVYEGGRFTANDDLVSLPAYAVLNAVVGYTRGRWSARLNVDNLLDHRYILTAGEGTDYTGQTVMPGAPRNLRATVAWRF